jgi:DUF1009 family protein
MNEQFKESSIGLIAGSGELPIQFAQMAQKKKIKVYTVAIQGETSEKIKNLSESFVQLSVGQLGSMLKFFKSKHVSSVVMEGQVHHAHIFKNIKLDLKALLLLATTRDKSGESLMKAVANEMEKNQLRVLDCRFLLDELIPNKGCLTKVKPTREDQESIQYGIQRAKVLAQWSIGQTLVIKKVAVVAVEALEGTNQTILRAYQHAGPKSIIIKVSSPSHDWRFDVPTIGMSTIRAMIKAKARGIVIESKRSFILQKDKVMRLAQKHSIFIEAV